MTIMAAQKRNSNRDSLHQDLSSSEYAVFKVAIQFQSFFAEWNYRQPRNWNEITCLVFDSNLALIFGLLERGMPAVQASNSEITGYFVTVPRQIGYATNEKEANGT